MTNISPAQYDKDVNDNENLPHSRAAECILAIYISEPHQFSVISVQKKIRKRLIEEPKTFGSSTISIILVLGLEHKYYFQASSK
uniref:Uncharacterized protein n=1 Tax=Aegilops tauschii TaxID=37682 RepID=M8BMP5_AEGTA